MTAGHWLNDASPLDTYSEAGRVALSLASSGSFSDPFPTLSTGPTAYVAPAYPYLVSRLILLFGVSHTAWWAIRLLTIAASASQWALLPWLARSWRLPHRAGVIGALVGAVLPIPGNSFKWEAVFVGLLFVILAGLTGLLATQERHPYLWAIAGALWGVGLLFSPVLLFPWFASVALLALWLRHTILWPNLLLLLLLPLCVITPWTIRNYKIFHHVLLIRNNLGFMLGSSNNDCATGWGWGDRSPACPGLENPYQNLKAAERFAREGEYQFNKEYLNAALAWIRQRPQRFLWLTLARIRYFWIPPLTYMESRLAVINSLAIAGLTLLSFPGLYFIFVKQRRAGMFLTATMLLYPAIYYVNQQELRYRYPILWLTGVAAAITVNELAKTVSRRAGKEVGLAGEIKRMPASK